MEPMPSVTRGYGAAMVAIVLQPMLRRRRPERIGKGTWEGLAEACGLPYERAVGRLGARPGSVGGDHPVAARGFGVVERAIGEPDHLRERRIRADFGEAEGGGHA